jgi:hypothetical protein
VWGYSVLLLRAWGSLGTHRYGGFEIEGNRMSRQYINSNVRCVVSTHFSNVFVQCLIAASFIIFFCLLEVGR